MEGIENNRDEIIIRVDERTSRNTKQLAALNKKMDDGFHKIENQLNKINSIPQIVADHERRITDMESDRKWLTRYVIGAVILSGLGFILSSGVV
jgi:hypothetical protein